MKVGICSLGCKVNMYESEYILSLFKNSGYEIGDFNDKCDWLIMESWCGTNSADCKIRQMISHIRIKYKYAILVVCGCFVESSKFSYTDDIDIVVGNYNKSKIVSLVEEYIENKKQNIVYDNMKCVPFEDMEIEHFEDKTRAFVKIQDGCCNFCSYCIIPYTRGPIRSKEYQKVLDEVTNLVKNGYKEIV